MVGVTGHSGSNVGSLAFALCSNSGKDGRRFLELVVSGAMGSYIMSVGVGV